MAGNKQMEFKIKSAAAAAAATVAAKAPNEIHIAGTSVSKNTHKATAGSSTSQGISIAGSSKPTQQPEKRKRKSSTPAAGIEITGKATTTATGHSTIKLAHAATGMNIRGNGLGSKQQKQRQQRQLQQPQQQLAIKEVRPKIKRAQREMDRNSSSEETGEYPEFIHQAKRKRRSLFGYQLGRLSMDSASTIGEQQPQPVQLEPKNKNKKKQQQQQRVSKTININELNRRLSDPPPLLKTQRQAVQNHHRNGSKDINTRLSFALNPQSLTINVQPTVSHAAPATMPVPSSALQVTATTLPRKKGNKPNGSKSKLNTKANGEKPTSSVAGAKVKVADTALQRDSDTTDNATASTNKPWPATSMAEAESVSADKYRAPLDQSKRSDLSLVDLTNNSNDKHEKTEDDYDSIQFDVNDVF